MFERILVPLDGSELAEAALPYAEELAGRLGSEITLLSVVESSEDPRKHMCKSYMEKMVDVTRQNAGKCHQRPGEPPISVQPVILSGNPAETIVRHVKKEGFGLIVMATRGQSGLRRWTLGSVADKVVRTTEGPVALIRAKRARPDLRDRGALDRVLIPLDGSEEAEAVVPYIEGLASRLKVIVVLLQVLSTGHLTVSAQGHRYIPFSAQQMESRKKLARDYLDKVGVQIGRSGVTTRWEVRTGDAAGEIIRFADEMRADIVAMSTRGKSGLERWLLGSVAERVLCDGNTPLLLVKAPAARPE